MLLPNNLHIAHPIYLWLIIPAVVLAVFVMLKTKSRRNVISTIVRLLSLIILIAAISEPIIHLTKPNNQLSVLFDTSYSITPAGRTELLSTLTNFIKSSPDSDLKLDFVPFAKYPLSSPIEIEGGKNFATAFNNAAKDFDKLDSSATNIEAAINKVATNGAPTLLITDGFQTHGDAISAARSAKGISIFPLIPDDDTVFNKQDVSILSLELPLVASKGDKVALGITVKNSLTENARGTLEIFLGDNKIFSQQIEVPSKQEKLFISELPEPGDGIHKVTAKLNAEKFSDELHKWITTKDRERILLLSENSSEHKLPEKLLMAKNYPLQSVVAGTDTIPTDLTSFSTVILNNISNKQLPDGFLQHLKTRVRNGGGLVIIGGDKSFGLGGYIDTPLEEISPLKFIPPQTTKKNLNSAVILLLDKSRSMNEQNRIVGAKNAALASIDALKNDDFVGVIGFDSSPFVVITLGKVSEVKPVAEKYLRNLTASGGTNPFAALSNARAQLQHVQAGRKHIIVLSDGEFPLEGTKYVEEINRIHKAGITLSTVAIGDDVDVPFLKMMAQNGKGQFHQTTDPNALPRIFLQDIKVATGEKTLNEQKEFPVSAGPNGLLSTQTTEHPFLLGFVETQLKNTGSPNLELVISKDQKQYPLLASWKFGMGTVIAFTSDATSRWATPWLKWKQFAAFWVDLINAAKPVGGSSDDANIDFDLRYSVVDKAIHFDLAIFDNDLAEKITSSHHVVADITDPTGKTSTVNFAEIKKGKFAAILGNAKPGDYELSMNYKNIVLPVVKLAVRGNFSEEIQGLGINTKYLLELARVSGGQVNPSWKDITTKQTQQTRQIPLFFALVLTAAAIIFAEAFWRERYRQS